VGQNWVVIGGQFSVDIYTSTFLIRDVDSFYNLTLCSLIITIDYMKVLMDADSLIKLTKAGLKEIVVTHIIVYIPEEVKREVIDAGKAKGCADALIVDTNIKANKLTLVDATRTYTHGDEAIINLFNKDNFDAVSTDDAKLIRRLKMHSIPFIIPGLIIYKLFKDKIIDREIALKALDSLSEFISADEHSVIHLLLREEK
jgi:rRNA-processing protein FCF1